ncbi:MAG: Gldg family protein, partial [Pseudomonadota bacterium]
GVADDIKALVVIGTNDRIPDDELFRLDQFLMRGGSIAFFVDGITVDTSTGVPATAENDTGLPDFLEHFGIKIRHDIVFDLQCDTVPIRGPFGLPLATKYPGWPVEKITAEHPSTFRLPVLTFPWGSSLKIIENPAAGQVDMKILAKSTDKSWREEGSIEIEPTQTDWGNRYESAKMRGPFVLAAAVEGKFRSFYDGKPLPSVAQEGGQAGAVPVDFITKAEKPGRILVSGSSQMVLDPITNVLMRLHRAGDIAANQAFLLNTVDWLTQDEDLIAIRAKGVENPRLDDVEDGTRNWVKYGNIIAWPLLFVVFGLVRWVVRSRRGRGAPSSRPASSGGREEKEEEEEEKG